MFSGYQERRKGWQANEEASQVERFTKSVMPMASAKQFEDLKVWREARGLTRLIMEAVETPALARKYSFCDQILRSTVSIMANIAEGFERSGNKEFVYFLYVAKGSAGELRSHLWVARDLGYLGPEKADQLIEKCLALSRQLSAFIKYLTKPPQALPSREMQRDAHLKT